MINVGVVGATGYTGLELLRILNKHSEVSSILVSTSASNKNENMDPFNLTEMIEKVRSGNLGANGNI